MSRYVNEFQTQNSDEVIRYIAENFFLKKGYALYPYKKTTEMVWQKGDGFWTAKQYMKVSSQNGLVRLEAWMAAWAAFGETGINGFWGWAVKKILRDHVQELTAKLHQKIYLPGTAPVPGHSPSAQNQTAPAAPENNPSGQPAAE